MSEFPTLAEVVAKHADTWHGEKRYYMQRITQPGFRSCTCGQWIDEDPAAQFSRKSFAVHVREAWAEACTITTVEQLDALPVRSVVRDADGDVHEMDDCGFWRAPRYPSILNAVVLPADLL
ncbi:hypothetical protein, partial [Mycolicibacterium fortuitum]|uniref:hypothetical protein n=1 Tax=Mycolicibacterium fortuitum TaxID=1766 RepID=UPI0014903509|nr:hypothetical protein [Mycolicibacterium fortuitum]